MSNNDNKTLNVPNLRFPEFSGEWAPIVLEDEVIIKSGISPTNVVDQSGFIPFYKVEQMNNCFKYQINTPYYANDNSKTIIKKGSIIFPKRGAAIMLNKIRILTVDSIVDTNIMALNCKDKLLNEFLYYYLYRFNLANVADTTSIPQINNKHIYPILVRYPSNQEQKKIISLLSSIDKKIELQMKIIEEYKLLKSGLLAKLFPKKNSLIPEYRFREFTDSWEQCKLGKVVEEFISKTSKVDEFPVLSSSSRGIFLQSEYFDRAVASANNIGYKIVPAEYFTYRSMSDTGEFTFNIQRKVEKGIVSPAYPVFKAKNNIINNDFLYYYLNSSEQVKNDILSLKEGGTRYALSFSKFIKLNIVKCNIDEQKKITALFNNLDNLITLHQRKCNKDIVLKNYLLNNLFI